MAWQLLLCILNSIYLSGSTSLFIHLSIWRTSWLFLSCGNDEKAAINIHVQILVCFHISCINTKEHDCWVVWLFNFVRNCQLFSQVAVSFHIPTSNGWEFLLLHILSIVRCCQCFGHPNRCVVVSHYCFNLRLSNCIWCWASFHIPIYHICIIYGEVSVSLFAHYSAVICFLWDWTNV